MFLKIYGNSNLLKSFLSVEFLGAQYGLYILIGYFISISKKINISNFWLYIISIINFIIIIFIENMSYSSFSQYNHFVWYNNIFLLITCTSLFILLNRINIKEMKEKFYKILLFTSKSSLAIYFMHPIILYFLKKFIQNFSFINPLKVFILFAATSFISVITIYLLSNIKFISKYVLVIKWLHLF